MPFVTQDHREKPEVEIVGDLCYLSYKAMVDVWKKEPRWTTAHMIFRGVVANRALPNHSDARVAEELAWQVFFQKYVMPYEDKKEAENGTI